MSPDILAEAQRELKTICDFVRWSASQFDAAQLFYGHGTDNAWDEAATIVLATLHLPPDSPSEVYQSRLTTTEKQLLLERINSRIANRLPAAYLTHEAWFASMAFYVDQRVLVPRSPFAELIQNQFTPWLDDREVLRIADVCTGSGCIACALAENFPEASVDAIDISTDALAVAAINVEQHALDKQVRLVQSDLLQEVLTETYDLIVANPPYVSDAAMEQLPAEYLTEPALGLAGGAEGIDLVKTLLQQARQCLASQGILVCEVGLSQTALEQEYPNVPFLWLDFERGGEGVFLLTKQQLNDYF